MNDKLTKSHPEFLSRADIEERANVMLHSILSNGDGDRTPPDLMRIVDVLQSKHNIRFSFTDDLGELTGIRKILGMFSVAPLTIRVCRTVPPWRPIFKRILAHELGHLVLHRGMIGDGRYISREKPFFDKLRQIGYRMKLNL